jgi:hypothetical protein
MNPGLLSPPCKRGKIRSQVGRPSLTMELTPTEETSERGIGLRYVIPERAAEQPRMMPTAPKTANAGRLRITPHHRRRCGAPPPQTERFRSGICAIRQRLHGAWPPACAILPMQCLYFARRWARRAGECDSRGAPAGGTPRRAAVPSRQRPAPAHPRNHRARSGRATREESPAPLPSRWAAIGACHRLGRDRGAALVAVQRRDRFRCPAPRCLAVDTEQAAEGAKTVIVHHQVQQDQRAHPAERTQSRPRATGGAHRAAARTVPARHTFRRRGVARSGRRGRRCGRGCDRGRPASDTPRPARLHRSGLVRAAVTAAFAPTTLA